MRAICFSKHFACRGDLYHLLLSSKGDWNEHVQTSLVVLTERTEHPEAIRATLHDKVSGLFVMHGRISEEQRPAVIGSVPTCGN